MEALCAASSDVVMPQMYEIVTKLQNARDEDSAEMLDIAFASKIYDAAHWLKTDVYKYSSDVITEGQNIMNQYMRMYGDKAKKSLENFVTSVELLKK